MDGSGGFTRENHEPVFSRVPGKSTSHPEIPEIRENSEKLAPSHNTSAYYGNPQSPENPENSHYGVHPEASHHNYERFQIRESIEKPENLSRSMQKSHETFQYYAGNQEPQSFPEISENYQHLPALIGIPGRSENPGSLIKNPGSTLDNQGSTLENHVSTLANQGSTLENHGSTLANQGSSSEIPGSTMDNQGSTLENQGSTLENQGSKIKKEIKDEDDPEVTEYIPEGPDIYEEDDSESSDEESIEVQINPNEVEIFASELRRIHGLVTEISIAGEDDDDASFSINDESNYEDTYEAYASNDSNDSDDANDTTHGTSDALEYDLAKVKLEENMMTSVMMPALKLHKLDGFLVSKYFSSNKNFVKKRVLTSLINKQRHAENGSVLAGPVEFEDGRVVCHLCSNIYNNKKLLARHVKQFHERSTMSKCDRCDYIGTSKGAVYRHILTVHLNLRQYHCPLCDKVRTEKRYYIIKHLKEDHAIGEDQITDMVKSAMRTRRADKDQLKQCPECPYTTRITYYMTKHMVRTHNSSRLPNPTNACPHCHAEFFSDPLAHACPAKIMVNEALEGVLTLDDGKVTCPQCQDIFENIDVLKSHYLEDHIVMEPPAKLAKARPRRRQVKVKVEQVVVKPDLDDESPQDLQGQVGEEKLLCDQCPFIGSSEDLTWHVKHVHKDRKNRCDHCSYSSNSKESLSNHIKRIHDGIASHLCHLCQDSFWSLKELGEHHRANHFEKTKHLFCDQPSCDFWAKLKSRRQAHMDRVHLRQKNFLCDKCNFKAFIQAELDSHIREKHLKIFRFNCHLCHKEGIRMGFPTRKRLHRHLSFAHNADPTVEDNEANRELIMNPPPFDETSEAQEGLAKKSKRGRRKGAKNRLKLDPDTGQLVRTLWKRPRKDKSLKNPSGMKQRPRKGENQVNEDMLNEHAALWWPPLMQNLVN